MLVFSVKSTHLHVWLDDSLVVDRFSADITIQIETTRKNNDSHISLRRTKGCWFFFFIYRDEPKWILAVNKFCNWPQQREDYILPKKQSENIEGVCYWEEKKGRFNVLFELVMKHGCVSSEEKSDKWIIWILKCCHGDSLQIRPHCVSCDIMCFLFWWNQ